MYCSSDEKLLSRLSEIGPAGVLGLQCKVKIKTLLWQCSQSESRTVSDSSRIERKKYVATVSCTHWAISSNTRIVIHEMLQRFAIFLLVFMLLAASNASGGFLYFCPMDEQAHWTCCCEDTNGANTASSHQGAACCCDIVHVEREPLRVHSPAWESSATKPPLAALPASLGQTGFRAHSAAQFHSPPASLFQSLPPIFQQNCSYLI